MLAVCPRRNTDVKQTTLRESFLYCSLQLAGEREIFLDLDRGFFLPILYGNGCILNFPHRLQADNLGVRLHTTHIQFVNEIKTVY